MSWGLLFPPIALVGLMYVLLETWCYKKFVACFRFQQYVEDEACQVPRRVLMFWVMVASVFAALHFVSVLTDEPTVVHLAVAGFALALSWAAGFCLVAIQPAVHASFPTEGGEKEDEAIELRGVSTDPPLMDPA